MSAGEERSTQSRDKLGPHFASLHSPIRPADVRAQDRILARVRQRNAEESEYEPTRVWRISPLGVEILDPESKTAYQRGDSVDLEIIIEGTRSHFLGIVVETAPNENGNNILGLRFSKPERKPQQHEDRRQSTRWICSDSFYPVCIAPSPTQFDEWMYLQVRDISRDGMQLHTSLRNKYLIPGMTLKATLSFPMGSSIQLSLEVVRVDIASIGGKDRLSIGTSYSQIDRHARRQLGQYLVQFSDADTLDDLLQAGFLPVSIARGTHYYYLQTEEDYKKVLELRFIANERAGHLGKITTASELAEIEDTRSRILVAKRNNRVIGTWRLRFPTIDERIEPEHFVKIPSSVPRRDQLVEASRLATHPDYRRNDLLAGMLRYAMANCISVDRPWLVTSCMQKYIPFYSKLGLSTTGVAYKDESWSEELHLMKMNVLEALKGIGVSPGLWNFVWREPAEVLLESGLVKVNGLDRTRIAVYKAMYPILKLAFQISSLVRERK